MSIGIAQQYIEDIHQITLSTNPNTKPSYSDKLSPPSYEEVEKNRLNGLNGNFTDGLNLPYHLKVKSKSYPPETIWGEKGYELTSSTEIQNFSSQSRLEIENLFTTDREEIFEDGMESEFSKSLVSATIKYGNTIIEILTNLMSQKKVNPEILAEAMRWLGRIDHPPTYNKRLWLLERGLLNSAVQVRDGAALGLASLGDLDAVPYLKKAVEIEPCEELRKDMQQILLELER